jgi:pyridoxamine 5'-phosphate oxidase
MAPGLAGRLAWGLDDLVSEQPPDLAGMRRDYVVRLAGPVFTEEDLASTWLAQFQRWFADAVAAPELTEPNAMVVATAAASGQPSARTVLLKGVDERGFLFFTNHGSRKATEAAENPGASIVFPWHPISRQIIVCGRVAIADRAETEAYFATRPRASQVAAWASPQSRVVTRADLAMAVEDIQRRFPEGAPVPAPPNWGGLRVHPLTVEFWQGGPNRLHDRLQFRLTDEGWTTERLGP